MEITINLWQSLSTSSFDENSRIHRKAFEKVTKLINERLSSLREDNIEARGNINHRIWNSLKNDTLKRSYETISVFGERGVGKTSFLKSLHTELRNRANEDGHQDDYEVLPVIDPTLIEQKGHVFLLIVSIIDELVCQEIGRFSDDNGDNEIRAKREKWHEAKNRLAKGMPTLKLDGMTYHEPQWNEDEYVMNRGIESVKDAFSLEANFHALVNLALNYLGKKAFILMFDDIDVDFNKGWDVLETIRKYLTLPQLIIILSGNMKLYSKNVRKQQWLNFGKELLKNEADYNSHNHEEYNRLVNEIEGQYMLKILKSENRVYLYNLAEKIEQGDDDYKVKYKEKDEDGHDIDSIDIKDAYKEIFKRYGIQGNGTIEAYTQFMLSTSMRTQVHFLYNAYKAKEENTRNIMDSVSAFSSRVYAQNIDIDLADNVEKLDIMLLHYLIETHLVEDAYQLIPTFDDIDTNSVVTAFSFIFSILSRKNKHLIFDYWIRICTVRNAMRFLTYDNSKNNRLMYVGTFCQYASLFQKRNLGSLIGNCMATILSMNEQQRQDGAVRLLGFARNTKGKGYRQRGRIDNVFSDDNIDGEEEKKKQAYRRIYGYLPLVNLMHSYKHESQLYFSFYSLMSQIGDLLKCKDEASVKISLMTACQPVSYQIRTSNISYNKENEDIEVAEFEDDFGNDEQIAKVANALYNWIEKYPFGNDFSHSAYLFGRIATRVYFSISNIIENRTFKLGSRFSLVIENLLNSSLIEEMKEDDQITIEGFNINNVATAPTVLSNNLKQLKNKDRKSEHAPLTRWLASCPLLYPYIDFSGDETIKEFVSSVIGDDENSKYIFENVQMTDILNKVAMQDGGWLKFSAAKNKISTTINYINDYGLDIDAILDPDNIDEAREEILTIFESVDKGQLKTIRDNYTKDENGKLVPKPHNN